MLTPKEFIEKQDDGYIAGDYTPNEVYQLMLGYAQYVSNSGKPIVSGSLPPDVAEIISFLQWMFRKVDKGDEPVESMRMLLMNRSKIDAIQLGGNNR